MLVLLLLVQAVAAANTIQLLHRVYVPTDDDPDSALFTPRSVLDVDGKSVVHEPTFERDITRFLNDTQNDKLALYQIAFQHEKPDKFGEVKLDIASVKAVSVPWSLCS